jgi:hypothetical protein
MDSFTKKALIDSGHILRLLEEHRPRCPDCDRPMMIFNMEYPSRILASPPLYFHCFRGSNRRKKKGKHRPRSVYVSWQMIEDWLRTNDKAKDDKAG